MLSTWNLKYAWSRKREIFDDAKNGERRRGKKMRYSGKKVGTSKIGCVSIWFGKEKLARFRSLN